MRSIESILALIFMATVLLACQANNLPATVPVTESQEIPLEASSTASAANPLQSNPIAEVSEMPSKPVPVEKFVPLSKKDLANRFHLDENEIALLKTVEMVWPNAALGCPAPGKVYAQGRAPSFQIWLETGGVKYVYNTDQTGKIILYMLENPNGHLFLLYSRARNQRSNQMRSKIERKKIPTEFLRGFF